MNFRISVTHLRIALLVANFGLAGGLVGMAGRGMMDASGSVSTVRVFEPSHFEFSEAESFDTRTKRSIIQPVADWIDPPPKPVITQPAGETGDETDETAATGGEGPEYGGPGPLAEEWEYEFYLLFPDAPLEGFVRLRRKGTEPAAQASSARRSQRSRIIRGRARLQRGARNLRGGTDENVVSFFIKDRYIKDDEKELEFFVDEATPEYVAYRMPGNVNTIYRLPHSDDSAMAEWPTKPSITLAPKVEENEAGEDEEESKPSKIQIVPDGFRDLRENEYQDLISGRIKSLEEARNLNASTVEDALADQDGGENAGKDATRASNVQRFSGGARQPVSPAEGARRMREALQDAREKGDITAEDEKLLRDAASGKLKVPAKK